VAVHRAAATRRVDLRGYRSIRAWISDPAGAWGASLSGLAAGEIVDHFGYSTAFLTLGAAALLALIVFALGMPETAEQDSA
jgi:hypothetical protein